MSAPTACPECLARSWLLARLAGHLDTERARIPEVLDLADEALIAAVGGQESAALLSEWHAFDCEPYREGCATAGLQAVCRCDPAYPPALWSLPAEPAVLHVAGGLTRFLELVSQPTVAIVGARRASPYALENARSLARGLGRDFTVVSGMAMGVDAAAHEGALEGPGGTVAVLPSAPERSYPPSARQLHRRIVGSGAAVSELGPGVPVRRWMFPARNRIIAALSAMTVVVAARQGSGAMLTARDARHLGRPVGAVPGQVTAPLSWGPHALLRGGAHLVAEPLDVVLAVFGGDRPLPPGLDRPQDPELVPLFEAIADGYDPPLAFEAAGLDAENGLAALAALEMGGYVRRQAGGRFSVVP